MAKAISFIWTGIIDWIYSHVLYFCTFSVFIRVYSFTQPQNISYVLEGNTIEFMTHLNLDNGIYNLLKWNCKNVNGIRPWEKFYFRRLRITVLKYEFHDSSLFLCYIFDLLKWNKSHTFNSFQKSWKSVIETWNAASISLRPK